MHRLRAVCFVRALTPLPRDVASNSKRGIAPSICFAPFVLGFSVPPSMLLVSQVPSMLLVSLGFSVPSTTLLVSQGLPV